MLQILLQYLWAKRIYKEFSQKGLSSYRGDENFSCVVMSGESYILARARQNNISKAEVKEKINEITQEFYAQVKWEWDLRESCECWWKLIGKTPHAWQEISSTFIKIWNSLKLVKVHFVDDSW